MKVELFAFKVRGIDALFFGQKAENGQYTMKDPEGKTRYYSESILNYVERIGEFNIAYQEPHKQYWDDVRNAIREGLADIGIGEDCDIHILRKIQALPYRALSRGKE